MAYAFAECPERPDTLTMNRLDGDVGSITIINKYNQTRKIVELKCVKQNHKDDSQCSQEYRLEASCKQYICPAPQLPARERMLSKWQNYIQQVRTLLSSRLSAAGNIDFALAMSKLHLESIRQRWRRRQFPCSVAEERMPAWKRQGEGQCQCQAWDLMTAR